MILSKKKNLIRALTPLTFQACLFPHRGQGSLDSVDTFSWLTTELFLRSAEHHPAAWQRKSLLRSSPLTSSGCQNLSQREEIHRGMRPTLGRWQWFALTFNRTEFSTQPNGLLNSRGGGGWVCRSALVLLNKLVRFPELPAFSGIWLWQCVLGNTENYISFTGMPTCCFRNWALGLGDCHCELSSPALGAALPLGSSGFHEPHKWQLVLQLSSAAPTRQEFPNPPAKPHCIVQGTWLLWKLS